MIKSKNKIILIAIASLIVIAAATIVVIKVKNGNNNKTNTTNSSSDMNSNDSTSKTDAKKDATNTTLPATPEAVPPNTEAVINITSLTQESGQVLATASTSSFSVGKCVYMFTADGAKPVTRETTGSCDRVSIPEVEFEKIGQYLLTVTAYDNTSKISTTQTIDVK